MENTISQAMQHRRVLFLISLPETPEFQDCIEDVRECLDELRQLHVDVREHIWREDLAEANNYDVVIVVAHHDISSDTLVLTDGALPISDFVSSMPTDFNGVIDFSSCYSATAFAAIKERCPQCKAQVALVETTLLRRLIIYPTLIECLYDNPTVDYGVAYKEVSKAFDGVVEDIDDNDVPMTHLGQKRTSIYAPEGVRRNSLVPINVFLHCDSERQEVDSKADRNTVVYIKSEDLGDVTIGDSLTLVLSFIPCNDIQHLHIEGPDRVSVTVTNDLVKAYFIVRIDKEYSSSNFGCYVSVLKDGIEPPIRKYPVIINIEDTTDEDLVRKLGSFFYGGDTEKIKEFLSQIRNANPKAITDTVNYFVEKKWISTFGNHHKGPLWKILYDANLYQKGKSNWNIHVK